MASQTLDQIYVTSPHTTWSGAELLYLVNTSADTAAQASSLKTFINTSAQLVTPSLGTPSSGTLTNATGLPAAGVVGTAAILGANSFLTTQTIIPATEVSPLVLTGGTLAGITSRPLISGTQTWNNSGLTAVGLLLNITNTSSNVDSVLADLQAGAVSLFSVGALSNPAGGGGGIRIPAGPNRRMLYGFGAISAATGMSAQSVTRLGFVLNSTDVAEFTSQTDFALRSNMALEWSSTTDPEDTADLYITRSAAATFQHGAANAASPVNQIVQSQGGAGANIAGANLTVQSGKGTGTASLSSLILGSPISTASGSTAQIIATGFTIKGGAGILTSYTVSTLPSANATATGAGATAFITDSQTSIILGLGVAITGSGGGTNKVPVYSDGTNWIIG